MKWLEKIREVATVGAKQDEARPPLSGEPDGASVEPDGGLPVPDVVAPAETNRRVNPKEVRKGQPLPRNYLE